MSDFFIGVDLGGTKIASIAAAKDGTILARDIRPTEAEKGTEVSINNIKDSINKLLSDMGDENELKGIGIGCPGPLSVSEGIVYSAPNLKWDNVHIKKILEDEFSVRVELDNDANVAGLAEWRFGSGGRCRNMIYVTISTGVGGGIITEGQLYRGSLDFAGEIGHMTVVENGPQCGCGKRGCLESVGSGTAIARHAKEMIESGVPTNMLELAGGDMSKVDAAVVSKAVQSGDPYAEEVLDEAIRYLSIGLGNVITIFNPDRVIIGGGVSKIGDRLFEPLKRMIASRALREAVGHVKIYPAQLGGDAGVLGSVCLVLD